MSLNLQRLRKEMERLAQVVEHARMDPGDADPRYHRLRQQILELDARFNGPRSHQEPGEKHPMTAGERLASVARGVGGATYGPTATHTMSLKIAVEDMAAMDSLLQEARQDMARLVRELQEQGGPWLEGYPLP